MGTHANTRCMRVGASLVAFGALLEASRPCPATTDDPCERLRPEVNGDDWTLLSHAAAAEAPACVSWLLANSKKLEAERQRGHSPLHEAAARADVRLVEMLLAAGEIASQANAAGETPLMALADSRFVSSPHDRSSTGHPCADQNEADPTCADLREREMKTAEMLIEHGGCEGEPTAGGQTSLARSMYRFNQHIGETLFAHADSGCVPELKQDKAIRWTLYDMQHHVHRESRLYLWQLTRLIQHGAPLSMEGDDVRDHLSVVHVLARSTLQLDSNDAPLLREAVLALRDRGIAMDTEDANHRTPLWYAVSAGCVSMAELLLELGSDPEHLDDHYETVLTLAAALRPSTSAQAMVDLLMARGASPLHDDKRGWSVAEAAYAAGNVQTALQLQRQGSRLRQADDFHQAVHSCDGARLRTILREPNSASGHLIDEWPICNAVEHCDVSIVEQLLNHGASPNNFCRGGHEPIDIANSAEQWDVVKVLCKHGAHGCGTKWPDYLLIAPDLYVGFGGTRSEVEGFYGVRPEVIFKSPEALFGLGIYGEVLTRAFSDLRLGTGLHLASKFWVEPSLGAYLRPSLAAASGAGVTAGAFIGFHGDFDKSRAPTTIRRGEDIGLRIDVYKDLSGVKDTTFLLGIQVDPVSLIEWLGVLVFLAG